MSKQENDEPQFQAIAADDPDLARAHEGAASSIERFRELVQRSGDHDCWAKLRFRDPDFSDELGEDCFLYLWLDNVYFHADEGVFSATFFTVPAELSKWHQVGERLGFEPEDIFDWIVNDDGRLHGGYTLRVVRERLPESERADFDQRMGAVVWEPLG